MKRRGLIFFVLIIITLYGGLLAWEGAAFIKGQSSPQSLTVDSLTESPVRKDGTADLFLSGSGFDRDTRIVVSADIGNQRAIVEHLPLWGLARDLLLSDKYAYIANSKQGLQILSLEDPLRPRLVRTISFAVGATSIEQDGDRLYVTLPSRGITIFNILPSGELASGPTSIQLNGNTMACQARGDLLFVAADSLGVRILDIATPAAQEYMPGHFRGYTTIAEIPSAARAIDLKLAGGVLFVSTLTKGLQIYDVADPARPRLLTTLHHDKKVQTFSVEGEILYIHDASGTISLYDVSHPASPTLRDAFPGGPNATDIARDGDILYLADSTFGLVRLDLNNQGPDRYRNVDVFGQARSITLREGYVYVVSNTGGLQVVNPDLMNSKQVLTSVKGPRRSRMVLREGEYFYHVDSGAVQLLKRSSSGELGVMASLEKYPVIGLEKYGDYLYLAHGSKGISSIDMTDPLNPVGLGTIPLSGQALEMAVVGRRLFVASMKAGLNIFDLTDPAQPSLIETLPVEGRPRGIASDGSSLFVATTNNGVQIYDLRAGQSPTWIGHYTLQWPLSEFERILDIKLRDGLLYLAAGANGLQILDVKNPSQPRLLGGLALPGMTREVQLDGNWAYVINSQRGVSLIDISSPEQPRNLGRVVSKKGVIGVLPLEKTLLLTTGLGGLIELPRPREISTVKRQGAERFTVSVSDPGYPGRYNVHVSAPTGQKTLYGVVEF